MPSSTLGQTPVPYFGRQIKLNGDREFANWTVTVMNDEDFAVRLIMENWSNQINTLISNAMNPNVFPTGYKASGQVTQWGKNGVAIRRYLFQGLWPVNVDVIPLDWDQTNAVEQFDVEFSLDDWIPDPSLITGPDDYNPVLPGDGTQS